MLLLVCFGVVVAELCVPAPLRIKYVLDASAVEDPSDQWSRQFHRALSSTRQILAPYTSLKCPRPFHAGAPAYQTVSGVKFPAVAADEHAADLIIRVSVLQVDSCLHGHVLAFAAYGRPWNSGSRVDVGWVNMCPKSSWRTLSILQHEVLHVMQAAALPLGVSRPKTHENEGFKLVTSPMVVKKTREFFDCPYMLGMASDGAHWFPWFSEDLLSVSLNSPSITPVSLASLDDQGFYHIDYSKVKAHKSSTHRGCHGIPKTLLYPVKKLTFDHFGRPATFGTPALVVEFTLRGELNLLSYEIPCVSISERRGRTLRSLPCLRYSLTAGGKVRLAASDSRRLKAWLKKSAFTSTINNVLI